VVVGGWWLVVGGGWIPYVGHLPQTKKKKKVKLFGPIQKTEKLRFLDLQKIYF